MINPNLLHAGYVKVRGSNYVTKFYKAIFSMPHRAFYAKRVCTTATEAKAYADRLQARWIKKYNLAIAAMIEEPA